MEIASSCNDSREAGNWKGRRRQGMNELPERNNEGGGWRSRREEWEVRRRQRERERMKDCRADLSHPPPSSCLCFFTRFVCFLSIFTFLMHDRSNTPCLIASATLSSQCLCLGVANSWSFLTIGPWRIQPTRFEPLELSEEATVEVT